MTKILYCLVFLFSCAGPAEGYARPLTAETLAGINACWKEQPDVQHLTIPPGTYRTDKDWIALHLELVEQTLRNRSVGHLSALQQQNRFRCLDILREYRLMRNFPVNEVLPFRNPVFIDPYDNFCAVGYLVKATGYEAVSRKIAAQTNYAYVREMDYPELTAWAADFGFTVDELAWIQPGYAPPPDRDARRVGKGTDGAVYELFADEQDERLYVGGAFSEVDSSITAYNVAYVTENNGIYTWHGMNGGVNGRVLAIARHEGNIFVGGEFTTAGGISADNIAYWDGSSWHNAGCIYGTVWDLAVFNGELYASGSFDVCAGASSVHFARWNKQTNTWQPIYGLNGTVYTMEVMDTVLLLGGDFTHIFPTFPTNVIKWNETSSFQPFFNNVNSVVKDFEWLNGEMYLLCDFIPGDTFLLKKLVNDTWQNTSSYFNEHMSSYTATLQHSNMKTLCAHGDTLMAGGDFIAGGMMWDPHVAHCIDLFYQATGLMNWFLVDSAIHKMVIFKGELIAGGQFKYGGDYIYPHQVLLNGIARKGYRTITSSGRHLVPEASSASIYPNPAEAGTYIYLKDAANAYGLKIRDVAGKVIASYPLSGGETKVRLPQVAAGIYYAEFMKGAGYRPEVKKIFIR